MPVKPVRRGESPTPPVSTKPSLVEEVYDVTLLSQVQPNGEIHTAPLGGTITEARTQEPELDQEAQKHAAKIRMLQSCTPGVLAELYVAKRDERDAQKEAIKAIQRQMELVKSVIHQRMDELGIKEFRPDTDKRTSVSDSELKSMVVKDREEFLEFVKDQLVTGADPDALDYLTCAAALKTAEEFMEANEGAVPPGTKMNRIRTLKVTVTQGKKK